jgi:hypothetical protein
LKTDTDGMLLNFQIQLKVWKNKTSPFLPPFLFKKCFYSIFKGNRELDYAHAYVYTIHFIQSYKLFHNTLFTFLSGTVWQCGEMEFKLSSCYCFRLTRTNGQIFRFLFFAKTIRGKLWKSLLWRNNDTWSLNLELRIKLTLLPLFFYKIYFYNIHTKHRNMQ